MNMIILWGLCIYILSVWFFHERRHHCTLCEMKIFQLNPSKSLKNLVESSVVNLCNTMPNVIMCNLIYSFTVRLLNAAQDFEKLMRSVLVNISIFDAFVYNTTLNGWSFMLEFPDPVYIECIGFIGINCGLSCPIDWYGPQCRLPCNCSKNETCNQFVGCLPKKSKFNGAFKISVELLLSFEY